MACGRGRRSARVPERICGDFTGVYPPINPLLRVREKFYQKRGKTEMKNKNESKMA